MEIQKKVFEKYKKRIDDKFRDRESSSKKRINQHNKRRICNSCVTHLNEYMNLSFKHHQEFLTMIQKHL